MHHQLLGVYIEINSFFMTVDGAVCPSSCNMLQLVRNYWDDIDEEELRL